MAVVASIHHRELTQYRSGARQSRHVRVMSVEHGVRLESIHYGATEAMSGDTSYLGEADTLPAGLCDALASDNLTAEQKADYRRMIKQIKRRIRKAREDHNLGLPAEQTIRPENPFGVES